MAPLDGLRVLDLSRLLPGGQCTLLLTDLGAEVVKVEHPQGGDGLRAVPPFHGRDSAAHIAVNRGKRSIALDLKDPEGQAAFLGLVETADVVVESFRPGVMDRLGLGFGVLRASNPGLVLCSISGFGQDGPDRLRAGHDLNYLARAGVLDITGPAGGPPVSLGVQMADNQTGALAAAGILAALVARGRTGRGSLVDASLTDASYACLSINAVSARVDGHARMRGRMPLSGALACYRIYRCADDRDLTVAALERHFWDAFVDALDVRHLADAHLDLEVQDDVIGELERLFRTRVRAEWLARLEPLNVCVAAVNTMAEAAEDAHLRARGMHPTVECAGGPIRGLGSPLRLLDVNDPAAAPPPERLPGPPALGEDTDRLLDELRARRNGGTAKRKDV